MIATLQFNLPEEEAEHLCAMLGSSFLATMVALDNHMRVLLKHGVPNDMTVQSLAQDVRNLLADSLAKVQE